MDPGSRRLLRPAWIVSHLLVAGLLVATVNMGFWQLRRLDGRQAHNASVAARADEPVLPLAEVLSSIAAGVDPDDLRFVRVTVTGVWDADREVHLANRSQGRGTRSSCRVAPPNRRDHPGCWFGCRPDWGTGRGSGIRAAPGPVGG